MEGLGTDQEELAQHDGMHGKYLRWLHGRYPSMVVEIMASPFKSLKIFILADGARALSWEYAAGITMPYDASLSVEYSRAGGTW